MLEKESTSSERYAIKNELAFVVAVYQNIIDGMGY